MNRAIIARAAGALVLAVALLPAGAAAQLNAESFARLGFNFSDPGARSAALGGAFIAVADDATAAETNPAGLSQLLYPQFSFEFKSIQYTRTLAQEGGGGPGGTDFDDLVALPSFASFTMPLGPLSFGVFRHELVDYRSTVVGAGHNFGTVDGVDVGHLFPYRSVIDIDLDNYGGVVALKLGSALSIGASGGVSRLRMGVDFARYRVAQFEQGLIANQLLVEEDDGAGEGTFANAGFLLRLGQFMSLGGVYKIRPKFDELAFRFVDAEGNDIAPAGGENTFALNVPDAVGVGLTVQPHDLFKVTASAVMNRWSQMAEDMTLAYTSATGGTTPEDYTADDAVDLHAGAELIVFMGGLPVALRGGLSILSPSNIYYTGDDPLDRALWGSEPADPSGQISLGFGTVLFEHLQFDAAGVVGEDRREFVTSLVYFF